MAARSDEGGLTGLRNHWPPNPPAVICLALPQSGKPHPCPLPHQRNPPASSEQPQEALTSPPSPPLSSFQIFSLHCPTASVHTHCQRGPGSGQSLQSGPAGKYRSLWPRRNQVRTWVLSVLFLEEKEWKLRPGTCGLSSHPLTCCCSSFSVLWSPHPHPLLTPVFPSRDCFPPLAPLPSLLSLTCSVSSCCSEDVGHPESHCTTMTRGICSNAGGPII